MTDWMNLLCWYIFIIMLCDRVTSAQPYTVSSLIYICCILHYFSKWTTYFRRSETSFSYLFRSEWKWIIYFPTNPKETVKLSKKSRNKHCSYREVHAYKHKWCCCFYRLSTWIRDKKNISWSETKNKCTTKNIRLIQCDYLNRTNAG